MSSVISLRPRTGRSAIVASVVLAVTGFVLMAAAIASGVVAGLWASLIVGAAVPLRHSVEGDGSEKGQAAVRRRPVLLVLAAAMTVAGVVLGLVLTD